MTLTQLRELRKNLDTLYYYSFDNLSGEQRTAFQSQIKMIDEAIQNMQEF